MKFTKSQFTIVLGAACLFAALPMRAFAQQDAMDVLLGTNRVGAAHVDTNADSPTLAAKEPAAAWDELQAAAAHRPTPPDEWLLKEPTPEEETKFLLPHALILANKAVDFYTRFPANTNEVSAKLMEFGIVTWAVDHGATNQQGRFDSVKQLVLSDTNLSEDDHFEIRNEDVRRSVHAKEAEGDMAMLAEFEKGTRMIQKEFPKRPDSVVMLLQLAENSDPDKSRTLLKEIATNDVPTELKEAASGLQKQLDRVGNPFTLQFTAVDGREVDLAKLHGKVVLVNFWATASEASVDLLSELKESYEKRHEKGLEVVGINMDEEKENLTNFVAMEKISWPQFFDGLNIKTKFAVQYGVKEDDLPAAWLLDKKGNLRYINAGFDMNRKIDSLLAE
jgi:peroxiredoxin